MATLEWRTTIKRYSIQHPVVVQADLQRPHVNVPEEQAERSKRPFGSSFHVDSSTAKSSSSSS